MKKIFLLLCLSLLLCGCTRQCQVDNSILVYIEDTEGCTIESNGQRIMPGEDAVFTLSFDYGLSLIDTDYTGKTCIDANQSTTILTLEKVYYPTRVKLNLSHNYAQITYHANGGYSLHSSETTTTISYSLANHLRPNTNTGTDLFSRDGHTLLCWNTKADGTGEQIGLGSRITVPKGYIDLYAQWIPWCPASDFNYIVDETITITGYTGRNDTIVIPEIINGKEVTCIASDAFINSEAQNLVLSKSIKYVETQAFISCDFETVTLFDTIISIKDSSFVDCNALQTLRINALEPPYGYLYRKESCYADKVDLLILAQGKPKLVFYGGCSMWYNLDGSMAIKTFGDEYKIINMALNGTVNSLVQMQIMGQLLEEGDIFFHTPELSSRQQLLTNTQMLDTDEFLWCGIENNYDLFTLVDLQSIDGVFDSFCVYLDKKKERASYSQIYTGKEEQPYMDSTGSIPFFRGTTSEQLGDYVYLDPKRLDETSMSQLDVYYDWYERRGVHIYISYACTNMDAVPKEQQNNIEMVEKTFQNAIIAMNGPILISNINDYLYFNQDFYDTNYHLLTSSVQKNTSLWLRDLLTQMIADGLWKGDVS